MITAPADLVLECNVTGGATGVAFGTATALDNLDPDPVITDDAPDTFPVGTTIVTWVATDFSGNTASTTQRVTVVDTTPPAVTSFAYLGPECLSPPDHRYAVVRVNRDFQAVVTDVCDPASQLVLAEATSNQPDNGVGDGDTTGDALAFGDRACVRRERQGGAADGRVYTLGLVARDASGNESTTVTVEISVPHDQGPSTRCLSSPPEVVEDGDPACLAP